MPLQGSGGGGGKPKPKPTFTLPWLVPQPKPQPKPESHSNPYVAVPGDFLSPAPESQPNSPAAKPPVNRPTYGPENPAPPNYGGPPPVYPDIISAPKPSSSSSSGKKPDRKKETPGKPQIAVASDFVQPETTPDISALYLEYGWSSEFGGRQPEVGSDDELVGAVAKSVQNEGLFEHYYDDLIAYLKNFASYGWDEESDRRAEAYLQKYREEMKLHYADQVKREKWLELADSPSVTAWKQHAAKSAIERVLVLDANTQAMLLDQPGVVGDDGVQTAGLQDYVVDVLRQFETIYIHNHPNGTGASAADLESAFAAGAGMLIVVTEGAYEEVYIRGTLGMELLRGGPASYEVGPLTTGEFAAQYARSQRQARLEAADPAEYVFEQGGQVVMIHKGEQIFLDAPKGVPLEVAQVFADRLYEVIMLESEELMQIIDSQWEVLWQRETSRQRSTAYGIWDLLLGTTEGVQSEIEFYDAADDAASLVADVEDLGQAKGFYLKQTLAETPYIFSHLFSFAKYQEGTYDDTLKLLDAIGEKLYDVNLDIFSSLLLDAQSGKNELISPYTNRAVASALEWDMHMVWTEQSAVEEAIEEANPPSDQSELVTEFFNLYDGGYLFSPLAWQEAIAWAEFELGIKRIEFEDLGHRIALGIAMVVKKHNGDRDKYREVYNEFKKAPS